MNIKALIAALSACLLAAPAWSKPVMDAQACDELLRFDAQAFALESGRLIYLEQHRQCRRDGAPVWGEIHYQEPDGKPFAYKWLDYRPGASTPDFRLRDERLDYSEGARRRGDRVQLQRAESGRAEQTEAIRPAANAVIDSGFDEFVKRNLPRLLAGETVKLQFLVAGQLDAFSFKAHGLRKVERLGRPAYYVLVEHDSFFVRLLVDSIQLWYDAETLRLLEYQGISNIYSPDGERYQARIVYDPESVRSAGQRQ